MKKELISKLLGDIVLTPQDLEKKYPKRDLLHGAIVARVAPSPTGFMHIGGIFASLVNAKLAHQSGGVFYLRIEDTDKEREVEGAAAVIIQSLKEFKIKVDEGELEDGIDAGLYGPYRQSKRAEIYRAYIAYLLERDLAYPCFCSKDELDEIRRDQEALGERTGYLGKWRKWRDRGEEEIIKALENDQNFVIRFKSGGNYNNKFSIDDLIRGRMELRENDHDTVIMKADGLPTYHFAHVVDDYLMRTTHALRGDEWISSLPIHVQLFEALGWVPPLYGHFAPICKMDGESKRKLSKRKDLEAGVEFYHSEGYPVDAVLEYLMTLASSGFEDWRRQNPRLSLDDYILTFKHLQKSAGPLFDLQKLADISKNTIAFMSGEVVTMQILKWASEYNKDFFQILSFDIDYAKKVFNIEKENAKQARKDIAKWSDAKSEMSYFFDELFALECGEAVEKIKDLGVVENDAREIVKKFLESYVFADDKEVWLNKIRNICVELGFAANMKDYKDNPGAFKGSLAHIANVLRVVLTGRAQSPDLYDIMQILGEDRARQRCNLLQ